MNKVLNLTQHKATIDQVGVIEPENKKKIQNHLTFVSLPEKGIIDIKVHSLVEYCIEFHPSVKEVMIGGAPFIIEPLAIALRAAGFTPVYAFSMRQSVEKVVNGEVIKSSVFKHMGFVK